MITVLYYWILSALSFNSSLKPGGQGLNSKLWWFISSQERIFYRSNYFPSKQLWGQVLANEGIGQMHIVSVYDRRVL